jgi:CNT family concentrative nucleoside transporter
MDLDSRKGTILAGAGVLVLLGVNAGLGAIGSGWALRLASFLGILFLIGIAFLLSEKRSAFPVRTVLVGLAIQLALALFVLKTRAGMFLFKDIFGKAFEKFLGYSTEGAGFVMGSLASEGGAAGFVLAVQIVAVIVFMGAVTRMLYHLGALQLLVRGMAWLMRRTMRISGAESLSAASNVFVGMVEAPLTVRPYVKGMTRSELFCVMTAGMATVAGTVMVLYSKFLRGVFGGIDAAAGHLLTASLMSAPAAILVAKTMIPETGRPATRDADVVPEVDESGDKPVNVMDAAARGALDGLKLGFAVVGILIAFYGLVTMANGILVWITDWILGEGKGFTLQTIVGYICAPVAIGMGIPPEEAVKAGALIGEKTVVNEFVAYQSLAGIAGRLSERTARIMGYALCGFANFGSVGIMIAGIGGMAPNQRPSLARLGLWSIAGGSLAAFMTGCLAGLLG